MDVKHLPKTIPDKDLDFSIDIQGNLTKENYVGDFKFRIPNLRTRTQIAKIKTLMSGGLELDPSTRDQHQMLAYLKATITSSPVWFTQSDSGYDLYDMNVVEAIYEKILELEETWLEKIWGKNQVGKEG